MNYAQQLRDAANFVRIQPQSVVVNIELAEPLAEWLEWEASWMEEHSSTFYASGVNTVAMIILGIPEQAP